MFRKITKQKLNKKDYILDKLDFIDYEWWERTEKVRYVIFWIISLLSVILSIFLPSGKSNLKFQKEQVEKVKTISKNQN